MARRSRRRSDAPIVRDSFRDLQRQSLAPLREHTPVAIKPPRRLQIIEDRRRWAPTDQVREVSGRPARVVTVKPRPSVAKHAAGNTFKSGLRSWTPKNVDGFQFNDPRRTVICLRRKVRKQVIFAKNLTRAGAGKKRLNQWSKIRC